MPTYANTQDYWLWSAARWADQACHQETDQAFDHFVELALNALREAATLP
jgi:hypothetical protein